ncbi:ParA family protein [Desulfovibrio inopinatus]|uniref:ParA family protein n=1 Tax=Desulfovibrio inopinatus TaxID=102109 RepID=UPI0003FEEABF|nr:ParA family protein [Desulfovibrio inopinatus]
MSVRVLAIANQKGGVGKTTTTLSLGAALTLLGKSVLVIDLDPHGCASVHMGIFPEAVTSSMYDIMIKEEVDSQSWKDCILKASPGNMRFDFVASSIRLTELDIELRERKNKGIVLKQAFEHLDTEYDYIVVDCPPHMGVLLVNAIVASDLLIIPIQTDFLALHGLRLIFDTIVMLNKVLGHPLKYKALATMFDRRASACLRVVSLLRRKLGDKLFKSIIGLDTKFREASARGKVVYDIAPSSKGAKAYMELAKEIVSE